MHEFFEWHEMRKHVPMLKDLKYRLEKIMQFIFTNTTLIIVDSVDIKIQKVVNETAGKMKTVNQKGCQLY